MNYFYQKNVFAIMEPAVGLSSWLILYGCYRPQAAARSFARLEPDA
jgi:hypothetical protein